MARYVRLAVVAIGGGCQGNCRWMAMSTRCVRTAAKRLTRTELVTQKAKELREALADHRIARFCTSDTIFQADVIAKVRELIAGERDDNE